MGISLGGISSFITNHVEDAFHDVVDSVEDAGSTAVGALEDFGRGVGEMTGGCVTNLLQGNIGEALESVERGATQAVFQTGERLTAGALSSGQKVTNGILTMLPWNDTFHLRTVSDRAFDMAQTAVDTGVGIASDCVRLGPDIANGVAGDLERSAKMAAGGHLDDAYAQLFTTAKNAGLNAAGGLVDLTARAVRGSASSVLTAAGNEPPARGLNASERAYLESIYGDSIDYDLIRIKEGGSLTDRLPASNTVGNTVYLQSNLFDPNGNLTPEGLITLGHEAGHVWQNQNGGGDYIHNALFAQAWAEKTSGDRNGAYEWRSALSHGESFTTMNAEEQAEVMSAIGQALANDGMITAADGVTAAGGGGVPYTPAELAFLREVAAKIKNGEWAG
jgi:hypothetical protein